MVNGRARLLRMFNEFTAFMIIFSAVPLQNLMIDICACLCTYILIYIYEYMYLKIYWNISSNLNNYIVKFVCSHLSSHSIIIIIIIAHLINIIFEIRTINIAYIYFKYIYYNLTNSRIKNKRIEKITLLYCKSELHKANLFIKGYATFIIINYKKISI